MTTDYGKLGRASMESLRTSTEQAAAAQECTLAEILRRNRDTVYGRRLGFGEIRTAKEFQERVPLTGYGDYEDYILRMIAGEERVLTRDPAVYYCVSSGTTGEAKYVPLTEKDLEIHHTYMYGVPFGMAGEYYRDLPEGEIFGKIFQIGEFAKTYLENGVMNGIRTGCIYQWMDREGRFDAGDYCAPKEVLFPDILEDLTYLKVRFALAERNLRAIHGVFATRVAGVMDYIRRNWDTLLTDMETGRVDEGAGLSPRWRAFAEAKLPPYPRRAEELRKLPMETLRNGMISKIWPQVRYVLAVGGKFSAGFTEKLREYAGDIPVYHFAYAASEGIFGVAERMNRTDRYILIPESGFFEFLSQSAEESGRPLLLWELETGKRYELVFTNHSGLYRYRMGDVIEVVGWYGQSPVVRFCYRKNQVLNLAGEKTNREQLDEAIRRFALGIGGEVTGYCVREDASGVLPRYLFYLECGGAAPPGAEALLDDCLCRANYSYRGCRQMNEIGRVRVSYLEEGSFDRYEKLLAAGGKQMGQYKRVCILDTAEKQRFFDSQKQRGEGEEP